MVKVRLSSSKKFTVIFFDESPSKIMKSTFYFMLKTLFIYKIFKFLYYFITQENGLIKKLRLISKHMTSTDWTRGNYYIYIYILPNISRRKVSQTMKLGQLISSHEHPQKVQYLIGLSNIIKTFENQESNLNHAPLTNNSEKKILN